MGSMSVTQGAGNGVLNCRTKLAMTMLPSSLLFTAVAAELPDGSRLP